MSYNKGAYEKFNIKNDSEDTRAFVKSIKRYIKDFLEGIRIEQLYSFDMEIVADEILVLGSYSQGADGIGTISLQSTQVNEAGIYNLIENLEGCNTLKIILDYNGQFFFFHPYGIERIDLLLNENLKEKVVYHCNEYDDQKSQMYVFEDRMGKLINGLIKPRDIKQYSHIDNWERRMFSFYAEFEEDISWELFREIQEAAQAYCVRYRLDLKFKTMSLMGDKTPLAEVGDIVIDLKHDFNVDSKKKDVVTFDEIVDLFAGIRSIYELARIHLYSTNPEWLFSPVKESQKLLEMRTSMDAEQNLSIGVYDINSNDVIPFHNSGDQMLELIENIDGAIIPWDVDSLD